MPCSPACSDPDATIVARNTNSYVVNDGGQLEDLTCTGGYQAYCCTGFVPSSITNSGNLNLYGQTTTTVSKRDGSNNGLVLYAGGRAVEKRGAGLTALIAGQLGALCVADAIPSAIGAVLTFGLSLIGEGAVCAAAALAGLATAAIIGWSILSSIGGWLFGGSPSKPNVGVPTTVAGRSSYGQWPIFDFSGGTTTSTCDCAVTYTCSYGMGWDEICDNQRWGINKLLNGRTVYQPLTTSRAVGANQALWKGQRIEAYRTAAQVKLLGSRYRCEVDEFPMGNLAESGNKAPQACRLVNGPANGKQGKDYQMWKLAQWKPCSTYRSAVCNSRDGGPPATWYVKPKLPSCEHILSDLGTGRLDHLPRVAVVAVGNTSSMLMVSTIKRPARLAGLHTLTLIHLELSAPPRLLTMAFAFSTMIRMCASSNLTTYSKYS